MKKRTGLLLSAFFIATAAYCQDNGNGKSNDKTKTISIKVVDKKTRAPIPGVKIKANGGTTVEADTTGVYHIKALAGTKLEMSSKGYKDTSINIEAAIGEVALSSIGGSGGSFSSLSYWVGASIGYNVNQPSGSGSNNIVGGASVVINPVIVNDPTWSFNIIGNIGNFVSSQTGTNSNTNLSNNVSKLAQSANGLSVGISASKTFKLGDPNNVIRFFGTTGYQLNSFQNANDTTTRSLNQWKNTIGAEFEGVQFNNGGKIHLGLAGTLGLFDSGSFQQIFMMKKSSLLSLDASVVLPLSSQFGFLLEGTYAQYTTPVYLIGIIIRPSQLK